ncbi:MAG: lytic transglycosylase domain-containing protein [Granulosicoccus sp.]|nr:lytic transglycosylase domain-containing protein [Granulosicoccus sp.]
MFGFDSVGIPNIETSRKKNKQQYKPYRELLKTVKTSSGKTNVVPNLRCYGYSVAATARRAARYAPLIESYARRYDISAELVKAVITRESCFREHAQSHVGAYGLMQLMPETAKWLGVSDIGNPKENLRAGIRYLAQLKRRFGSVELALAAYNAGPGNVERYDGIPPFKETQSYVKTVMSYYQSYVASKQYASL